MSYRGLALCCLGAILLFLFFFFFPTTYYPIHVAVRNELSSMKGYMIDKADDGTLPPATLADTIKDWEAKLSPFDPDYPVGRWLRSGKDAWGSDFVYQVDAETRIVTIRSVGANKIDENGAGDDVQRQFDMNFGAFPPAEPRERLRREFAMMQGHLVRHAVDGTLPSATLGQTMKEWEEKSGSKSPGAILVHPVYCSWLRSGKGPWGSPLVYRVDAKYRIVTIRSLGPNQKDENGDGDDVEWNYDLNRAARTPEAVPHRLLQGEFIMMRRHMWRHAKNRTLPPATLVQTVKQWEEQSDPKLRGDRPNLPKFCPWLRSGKDPWNSDFVFQVDAKKRVITIRSLGPNQNDEHGAGDDVELKYDLKRSAQPPK